MKNYMELHEDAMDIAGQALLAKSAAPEEKRSKYRDAALLDIAAAALALRSGVGQPTAGIIAKSAAALAADAGEELLTKSAVALCLAGDPPKSIVAQCRRATRLAKAEAARAKGEARRG